MSSGSLASTPGRAMMSAQKQGTNLLHGSEQVVTDSPLSFLSPHSPVSFFHSKVIEAPISGFIISVHKDESSYVSVQATNHAVPSTWNVLPHWLTPSPPLQPSLASPIWGALLLFLILMAISI